MTRSELIAMNKAYAIDISNRTYIVSYFNYLEKLREGKRASMGLGEWIVKEWRFIGDVAIRKSDGFTVTRDEVEATEIWS